MTPRRAPAAEDPARAERRWAARVALVVVGATCVPYALAWAIAWSSGTTFVGNLHLPDDTYVYLSWMRQAAEGRLTFLNRFTTDPQPSGLFNALFLLLGSVSRFTGLPGIAVFQLARVGLAFGFLMAAHRLLRRLLPTVEARRAAFLLLCFSAGLGWLFPRTFGHSPTDLWQVESNTFLSLYMNPLFAAALWLMVLIFERLLAVRETGRWRPAMAAGVAGLLLANIHSYDILIVWAVWATFLTSLLIARLEVKRAEVTAAALLILQPLPAVAAQWAFYQTNPLFHARALVPTPSPALVWSLLGLGLLVPLAIYGAGTAWRATPERRSSILFLISWGIVALALPYAPVAFQRKLAMGVHLPWAMLAGWGLSAWAGRNRSPLVERRIIAGVVALSSLTLFRWGMRAAQNVQNNWCEGDARLFLRPEEREAATWLSQHGRHEATLAAPLQFGGIAGYLPGLSGVFTYAGHWGETPEYARKVKETLAFYSARSSDDQRTAFLRRTGTRFVLWTPAIRETASLIGGGAADLTRMPGLEAVYTAGEGADAVTVFRAR